MVEECTRENKPVELMKIIARFLSEDCPFEIDISLVQSFRALNLTACLGARKRTVRERRQVHITGLQKKHHRIEKRQLLCNLSKASLMVAGLQFIVVIYISIRLQRDRFIYSVELAKFHLVFAREEQIFALRSRKLSFVRSDISK